MRQALYCIRVPQWDWASAARGRNLLDSMSLVYWLSSRSSHASLLLWDHLPNKLLAFEYSAQGQIPGEHQLRYIQSHCLGDTTWGLISLKHSPAPLALSVFVSVSVSLSLSLSVSLRFPSGPTPAPARNRWVRSSQSALIFH